MQVASQPVTTNKWQGEWKVYGDPPEIKAIYDHFARLAFPNLKLDILVNEVDGEQYIHITKLGVMSPIKSFLLADPNCFKKVEDYYWNIYYYYYNVLHDEHRR